MAKLPTSLLPRSRLLPASTPTPLAAPCRPTTSQLRPTAPAATTTTTQQVRHATQVTRPKRPFTWTQIVQLSDGSTYTTRSTSPLPVYRSTKDTRNHLTWQPSEASLQNVEVDEAGKLASFRSRFGAGYDLDGGSGAEVKKVEVEDAGAKKGKKGRKAEAVDNKAAAPVKEEVGVEDSFASLLGSYVVDQPQLRGGRVAGKDADKKGKKK